MVKMSLAFSREAYNRQVDTSCHVIPNNNIRQRFGYCGTENYKMLRNILRTSRWLARQNRQINILVPVFRKYAYVRTVTPLLRAEYSTPTTNIPETEVDPVVYEEICSETLESLCDYFEEIIDDAANLKGADITYSVSLSFRKKNFFKVPFYVTFLV